MKLWPALRLKSCTCSNDSPTKKSETSLNAHRKASFGYEFEDLPECLPK